MELLQQCQIWNENEEYQKIIDALEAVPDGGRTPEMDSELARAYNNLAQPQDRELFEKAIGLLEPHAEYFAGDHCWNFRMGYAWFYLDREDRALGYFEKALEARPGDEDTLQLIEACRRGLAMPRFGRTFPRRVREAWAAFLAVEGELRAIMDAGEGYERGEEMMGKCGKALGLALEDPSFELGHSGEKYQLVLSAEGALAGLFPLVYFRAHAPAEVLERWDILVGRQPSAGFALRAGEEEIRPEEVQVWAEKEEDGRLSLSLWCGKLQPLQREDGKRAWWLLSILTDQVLGEVNAIAHVGALELLDAPKEGPALSLAELPRTLEGLGLADYRDGGDYLENCFLSYQLEPEEDPEADLRLDIFAGTARLPALAAEYLAGESGTADGFFGLGIAAGFFAYPLDGFQGEDRSRKILEFRDALEAAVAREAGEEAVFFLGGATGLSQGYLDFLAWDLSDVLDAAQNFFEKSDLPWAFYHSFRRDVPGVRFFDIGEEPSPEPDPETGSIVLRRENIEAMEAMTDGTGGYYGRMLAYLENLVDAGAAAGRFSRRQARQDLQLALWYAFACNNIGEYEAYYRAAQWMPSSQRNAAGCGTWYYRYSCALLYCGRLEEALRYSEQGVREEPSYPWGWLELGKLRAHFGDRAGALEAAEQGLRLVPGDYEFRTLKKEILAGASLEEMELHWIDPGADAKLHGGLDEGAADKIRSIQGIVTDPEGLEAFRSVFGFPRKDYRKDCPYCSFPLFLGGAPVDVVFQMNEAALSKKTPDWFRARKELLEKGSWLAVPDPRGGEGRLQAALFAQTGETELVYRAGRGGENPYFRVRLDANGLPVPMEETQAVEFYSGKEMEAVEEHITAVFGPVRNVFHELVSPDIHVDICVVEPSEERDFYTLVTMGMGAHRMAVPEELREEGLERAELALCLPPDWKLDEGSMKEERWYWPVRLLKGLTRLPIDMDTWLGWGHTVDNGEPYSEETGLCGALLLSCPGEGGEDGEGPEPCRLPGGEEVNFYQVIPLYREEMAFKQQYGAEALLEMMEELEPVVRPDRPNALEGWEPEE